MKKIVFTLLSLVLCNVQATAQNNHHNSGITSQIIDHWDQLIKTTYGTNHELGDIVNPDSMYPGKYAFFNGKLIFTVEGDPTPFIGVASGDQILWTSDKEMGIGLSPRIDQILDLNNDGKPEILVLCAGTNSDDLWIYSWDGTTGKRINAVKDGNLSGYSSIGFIEGSDSFQFVDTNSDGVLEIRVLMLDDNKEHYFYWDGSQYREGTPGPFTVLPRNLLTVEFSATAEKVSGSIRYRYRLLNNKTSRQAADDFMLEPMEGLHIIDITGRKGWKPASGASFVRWTNLFWYGDENYLQPGKKDTSFSVVHNGLPAIGKYFVQGHNGNEFSGGGIETNSASGFTICPAASSDSIFHLSLPDTLISYTLQSVTLGWLAQKKDLDISDGESNKDSIATNLIKRLQSIKSTLVAGDSVVARGLMDKFLAKVEAEHARSANRMSDECYALLKHNGEYLRDRLPSQ